MTDGDPELGVSPYASGGGGEDGSPRYRLVLARRPGSLPDAHAAGPHLIAGSALPGGIADQDHPPSWPESC
jgi:hypothetical protein